VDLSRARVALRERSVLDVLDLALRFLAVHARSYARLTAVVILPAALLSLGLVRLAGWGWGWVATIAMALIAQAPFTLLAARLVFEPEVRIRDVLGASARVVPRLLMIRIIQLFLIVAGLLFFVFPGLWIGISLLFVVEVAILERAGLGAAISRSFGVVSGQSGRPLVAALALLLLHVSATLLGDDVGRFVVGSLFQFREPPALWSAGGSPLALLGFWLFVPYAATARFFAYLDLRTRSEGWDIQTRFLAILLRSLEVQRTAG
jgi:hypothetical protein